MPDLDAKGIEVSSRSTPDLATSRRHETDEIRRHRLLLERMKSAVNPMGLTGMSVLGARGNFGIGR